ncbi:MAG TPA: SDR family NAD(P)-dependent oxidoreductase [Pseudonocardia sp.]
MPRSFAVFGAGPGLGQAVARRYAREGYEIVLVGRRRDPLDRLAATLADGGAAVHPISADLADTAAVPRLAEQIRAAVGDLDAFYYASSPNSGFVQATELHAEAVRDYLPLAVYSLLALVHEFLPGMLERGDGAILVAQGAAALRGRPGMSGPGLGLAAQRNYLESLEAEIADQGVYVGRLYIGAAIENTPFHARQEAAIASGARGPHFPSVSPDQLAELLWSMHRTRSRGEASYPEELVRS